MALNYSERLGVLFRPVLNPLKLASLLAPDVVEDPSLVPRLLCGRGNEPGNEARPVVKYLW